MLRVCSFKRSSVYTTLVLTMLSSQFASADVLEGHHQLCWARGTYDRTVYFAEIADREDRAQSFEDMIGLFGIVHAGTRCSFHADHAYERERSEIFEAWKALELDLLNTTFLSDLDY